MNNREELIQERMAKIHDTMSRQGPKVFILVPWSSNSDTIRWFSSLKHAVAGGKRLKELDYTYDEYYISLLLYDGTSTNFDYIEIDELLVFEESIACSSCLRCAAAAASKSADTA
jgi:hypothetical protein